MRRMRTTQTSPFDPETVDHPVAALLERASAWLDGHPDLAALVAADLGAGDGRGPGRHGPGCETVPRCAVLMHIRRETYRGLEFALRDSLSARRFARLADGGVPGKSALQATVGSVSARTWERINLVLLDAARDAGVERGDRLRVDSTVTATHILSPTDSRLLYDGVRVLTRLLSAARDALGPEAVAFHDHRRAAKRRHLEIGSRRGAAREDLPAAAEAGGADPGPCRPGAAGGGVVGRGVGAVVDGEGEQVQGVAGPGGGPGAAPGAARRDGSRGGEGDQPVRAAHRHRGQGRARHAVRAQGQLRHRALGTGALGSRESRCGGVSTHL